MPAPYGVISTGFNSKTLAEIIQEIETENSQASLFGPAIIQTAQSPLGQLNALFGDYSHDMWQLALNTYQSFDADQADGIRLDNIAKLRNITRILGESDVDFRQRITNTSRTDISVITALNQIRNATGVEWASVRENNSDTTDALGLPAHSLAFAVVGGTDADVGQAIYDYTVAGIGLDGNMQIEITTSGYCRPIRFIRPTDKAVELNITVTQVDDLCACNSPAEETIKDAVVADLMGTCGLRNADSVTQAKVRAPVEALGGNSVVDVQMAFVGDPLTSGPLAIGLYERALITADNITVAYV